MRDSTRELAGGVAELGRRFGRAWASNSASPQHLERLVAAAGDEDAIGNENPWDAYSPADRLFFAIEPDTSHERVLARDFWEAALDGHDAELRYQPELVRGFLRGAVTVAESLMRARVGAENEFVTTAPGSS